MTGAGQSPISTAALLKSYWTKSEHTYRYVLVLQVLFYYLQLTIYQLYPPELAKPRSLFSRPDNHQTDETTIRSHLSSPIDMQGPASAPAGLRLTSAPPGLFLRRWSMCKASCQIASAAAAPRRGNHNTAARSFTTGKRGPSSVIAIVFYSAPGILLQVQSTRCAGQSARPITARRRQDPSGNLVEGAIAGGMVLIRQAVARLYRRAMDKGIIARLLPG